MTGQGRAADGPPRVALVEDPDDTSILPRLRAELTALGLDVRTVAKNENEQLPRDLVETARSTGSIAAFRIVIVGNRADVWIADRATGKVVLREMLPRGAQVDGRVVALRAVELLRVSLMELDIHRPVQNEVSPPATVTQARVLLQDFKQFSLHADSLFLWSPGGCSPAVGVAAGVAWRPTWIGVRLSGSSVLDPASINRPEGDGEVTTRWLALDAVLESRRARIPLQPRLGLGVAAMTTSLRGTANSPRPSGQGSVFTLSPVVSVAVGWTVHSQVRIALGAAYLRPLRSADILVAGKTVGHYGRDIVLANLGLEVLLP
jgi:hypothetical protein